MEQSEQKEKLTKAYAFRITESEHEIIKVMSWPKRKKMRLRLRKVLEEEIAS